jgi:hypothetical protein
LRYADAPALVLQQPDNSLFLIGADNEMVGHCAGA